MNWALNTCYFAMGPEGFCARKRKSYHLDHGRQNTEQNHAYNRRQSCLAVQCSEVVLAQSNFVHINCCQSCVVFSASTLYSKMCLFRHQYSIWRRWVKHQWDNVAHRRSHLERYFGTLSPVIIVVSSKMKQKHNGQLINVRVVPPVMTYIAGDM